MADPTMQCRVNGGGEGGGMRTVECLRGRLLAERVASKAAKEAADQLAKRLDELEKKLSDEVKIRDKAERRLRRAIKKLESLKILDVELSDSSIGSLSSNGCSGHPAPEMEERNNPGSLSSIDSTWSGPHGDGDGDIARLSSAGSCTQVNSSQDGNWCSVLSEQYQSYSCQEENRMGPEDTKNCSAGEGAGDHDSEREQLVASNGSSKSEENNRDEGDDGLALVPVDHRHNAAEGGSRTGDDTQAAKLQAEAEAEANEEEEENDELAIVLVDPQPQPGAKEEARGNDVQSVLFALRQVKEQLRCTIQRRAEFVAHQELYGH